MRPVIGILGVGLIGASIGLRARALGQRVIGFDVSAAHLEQALARAAIDTACSSVLEVAEKSATLVIATPLEETLRLLRAFAAAPPRADLVLDVASVKTCVVDAACGLGRFVATHPIAGSEQSGPLAARGELFVGRTWAYVPASPMLDSCVVAFIESMGARAVGVCANEHDRIVAATSHLPQLLSVALAAHLGPALADDLTCALSGTGLRSMTRLGTSAWSVWKGILEYNGPHVAKEVRRFAAILTSLAEEVAQYESQSLAERFTAASAAVGRLHASDSDSARVSET